MEERSNMRWKLRGPAQPRKFSHVEDPGSFVFGRLVCQKVVWAYSDPGSLVIHRKTQNVAPHRATPTVPKEAASLTKNGSHTITAKMHVAHLEAQYTLVG